MIVELAGGIYSELYTSIAGVIQIDRRNSRSYCDTQIRFKNALILE